MADLAGLEETRVRDQRTTGGRILAHLNAPTPFPVRAIQVDGGSEFMAEFEEACARLGIALFVLPPRSPKLNGHVEQWQRTFKDEFCTRPLPPRIPELQRELDATLCYYNRERPHRALNGLSPPEFLARMQEKSVLPECLRCVGRLHDLYVRAAI